MQPYMIKGMPKTINTARCDPVTGKDGKTTCVLSGGDCKTKWLDFKDAAYIDKTGKEQHWQYIQRTGGKQVVTMACHDDQGRYVIIKQPRVPLGGKINWGFPAGLVDPGESIEQAAKREMKEETGYDEKNVVITSVSKPLPKSAGLTDEASTFLTCRLIGNAGKQELEQTENIERFLMLPREVIALGNSIDPSKESVANELWTYMQGHVSNRGKGRGFWRRQRE